MTFSEFSSWKGPSREGQWMKMVFISLGVHLLVLALFLNVFPRGGVRRNLEPTYTVNLVAPPGGGPAGQAKAEEPTATPSPPVAPKPIPLPKPVLKQEPDLKEERSKTLEKALEQLKKKVQQEKSLENAMSQLEKKAQQEKSLENALRGLEKKVKAEQSLDKALTRLENKKGSAQTGPGTGLGGPGTISSSVPGGQDGLGIQFQLFHAALRSRIKNNWGLPEGLLKRNDISAELMVRIGRTGRIEDFRFERKSGIEAFDQEVLRTLKKSDPLPPIPAGYPKNSYEVILTFHSKELSGN
ncbi:MAG: TonB family protein [Deltaproteobacteria bacterium]|nr:TonB family protein [Deltaproteobacteria bacterium]